MSYLVLWTIDIEDDMAGSPEQAAREAAKMMLAKDSTATVFLVNDYETGVESQIDLQEYISKLKTE